MKTEIKNTIDQMINLVNDKGFKSGFFAKADKKLSRPIVYAINRDILAWTNEFFIKLHHLDPEKWSLETDGFGETFEKNLIEFLNSCPAIAAIFHIENHTVTFNPDFSAEDITELRQYVKNNQQINLQSKETRQKS